ncbi:death on curing protein [Roseivivax lentus]|uniref:Death on curing protein n=1 Tax=Roseivivax lentus TaxID=633194 RepID=A0A1N7PGK8_9RHOB|nr:type II toxin-antitoxin system death-on-curing family toxin [Roseivivax lentus]SIT09708.1 death on curing protein [Roseivivax lentus]
MADAIDAHDAAIKIKGRAGISNLSLVQSAISRPYHGYHKSLAAKAAALMESIVGNHGFVDGNKRTAWLLVELLIERSGYVLGIPDDEPIDDLVVAVATKDIGFEGLEVWFRERLLRRDE